MEFPIFGKHTPVGPAHTGATGRTGWFGHFEELFERHPTGPTGPAPPFDYIFDGFANIPVPPKNAGQLPPNNSSGTGTQK